MHRPELPPMQQPGTEVATPETAADSAWELVLNGFREALTVPGLPDDDEASLRRCYRLVAACARQPALALLPEQPEPAA